MSPALCARRELRRFLLTVGLGSAAAAHIRASPLRRVRSLRELAIPARWHNGRGELKSRKKGCFPGFPPGLRRVPIWRTASARAEELLGRSNTRESVPEVAVYQLKAARDDGKFELRVLERLPRDPG